MQRTAMHHAPACNEADSDALVSIAEAARDVGVHRSTLSRQVQAGKVRSHDGKVRLSEVIADRRCKLKNAIWDGRRRAALGVAGALARSVHADATRIRHATTATPDATVAGDDAPLGPRPFHIGANGDVPLTRGLVRQLGELIGSDVPGDPSLVAYDLATTSIDICQQELARLKAKAGETE